MASLNTGEMTSNSLTLEQFASSLRSLESQNGGLYSKLSTLGMIPSLPETLPTREEYNDYSDEESNSYPDFSDDAYTIDKTIDTLYLSSLGKDGSAVIHGKYDVSTGMIEVSTRVFVQRTIQDEELNSYELLLSFDPQTKRLVSVRCDNEYESIGSMHYISEITFTENGYKLSYTEEYMSNLRVGGVDNNNGDNNPAMIDVTPFAEIAKGIGIL